MSDEWWWGLATGLVLGLSIGRHFFPYRKK